MYRAPRVFEDEDELGRCVAEEIVGSLRAATAGDYPFLLGAPSGRTPRSTYRALAELLARQPELDLDRLVLVMMDDYVVPRSGAGAPRRVAAGLPHSCEGFARREILAAINDARAKSGANGIPEQNLWFPDAADPAAYDRRIESFGGIDFFILASGSGDGHVAFNPPGSARDSETRVVDLSVQTRTDNMQTFPDFGSLDDVPKQGVTVGIATISRSRRAVMIAIGGGKRLAVSRLLAVERYDPSWPATVVHEVRDHAIFVDAAALP